MLEGRVQKIMASGLTDLNCDLTLFAIRYYARRNFIAHGETVDLYQFSVGYHRSQVTYRPSACVWDQLAFIHFDCLVLLVSRVSKCGTTEITTFSWA